MSRKKRTAEIKLLVEAEMKKAYDELGKLDKRIDGIGKRGKKTNLSFKGLKSTVTAFISALALRQVAQFGLEITKLAASGANLRRSLSKLLQNEGLEFQKYMADMKRGTAGTVSEIKLMEAATQAKFLGIDLKNLPMLLEFAKKRADDTGQSVDYLVESIVRGIGRKSVLILDNLGITMQEIDREIQTLAEDQGKWTGKITETTRELYFQEAVTRLATRGIKESAAVTDSATDKLNRNAAAWENFKEKLGSAVSGFTTEFISVLTQAIGVLSSGLMETNEEVAELISHLEKSRSSWESNEKELTELLKQYDKLTSIQGRNTEQQEELNDVISRISELAPSAITAVDSYGNALDINSAKVQQFIKQQQELLKVTHQEAYDSAKEGVSEYIRNIREAQEAIEYMNKLKLIDDEGWLGPKAYTGDIPEEWDEKKIRRIANLQKLGHAELQGMIRSTATDLERSVLLLGNFEDIDPSRIEQLSAALNLTANEAQILEASLIKTKSLMEITGPLKPDEGDTETPETAAEDAKRIANLRKRIAIDGIKDRHDREQKALDVWYAEQVGIFSNLLTEKGTLTSEEAKARFELESYYAEKTRQIRDEKEKQASDDALAETEKSLREKETLIKDALSVLDQHAASGLISYDEAVLHYTQMYELAADNAMLQMQIQQELTDFLITEWERRNWAFMTSLDQMTLAYDQFVDLVGRTDMTGAEKWLAIRENMKLQFVKLLGEMLKAYILSKVKEKIVQSAFEKGQAALDRKTLSRQQAIAAQKIYAKWAPIPGGMAGAALEIAAMQAHISALKVPIPALDSGALLKYRPGGHLVQVGEKRDEVVIPVDELGDFYAGLWKLPGNVGINDLPVTAPSVGGGTSITRTTQTREGDTNYNFHGAILDGDRLYNEVKQRARRENRALGSDLNQDSFGREH